MFRRVKSKTQSQITAEWDALAEVRHRQINSGEDISYTQVLVPALSNLITPLRASRVLDAGCGTGAFSVHLSQMADEVVGVDASGKSIEIARVNSTNRTKFFHDTIESFADKYSESFDLVVANMVLMDALSLDQLLVVCTRLMKTSGALVFSITHPWFWPAYYGYSSEPWFKYEEEVIIEGPFRISAEQHGTLISTHVHRPLTAYFEAFHRAGLVAQIMKEPTPPADAKSEYLARWKLPRYLVGTLRLNTPDMGAA